MDYLMLALGILQFNESAVAQAAKDEDATLWAAIFIAIAGALPAASHLLIPALLAGPLSFLIGWAIAWGLIHLCAKMLGGGGHYVQLFRAQGLAMVVLWVGVIPLLGMPLMGLAGLYNSLVAINNVRLIHRMSMPGAVVAVILPSLIMMALAAFLAITFGFAILAMIGLAAAH